MNLEKAPYSQKQWGATLGGPLKRDRTFFFLSQERTDITDNRVVTIDPAAAAILDSVGFPVELGNVPLGHGEQRDLGKLDHHWSPLHSLVARVSYADIEREGVDDFGGTVAKSRGTVQLRNDWSCRPSRDRRVLTTVANEFRSQFAHEDRRSTRSTPPAAAHV